MNLWKLRFSIYGTLAIIIGLSTLIFTLILSLFSSFSMMTLAVFVVMFNLIQWLVSPHIIDGIYKIKTLPKNQNSELYETVKNLSRRSGIETPKIMISKIPIPNAFAYGSPIAGNRVAITEGLMKNLQKEEIEAVIGHEIGHLKHKDVQIMMFVSLLPALLYYIGYSLMLSSFFSRRRQENGGSAILGLGFLVFSWILNIFTLYLSRLREYYADSHSIIVVEDGSRKLSEGLAKIVQVTKKMRVRRKKHQALNSFKVLFISDPDQSEIDAIAITSIRESQDQKIVQDILSKRLTTIDKIIEIFSTHPNIIKRLNAIQKLSK